MSRDPKTIELRGEGLQHEGICDEVNITPGMLVRPFGPNGQILPHNVAGGAVVGASFANEYWPTGRTIDDDYHPGDQVIYTTYPDGAFVYSLLTQGQNVSRGDSLSSDGNGRLREAQAGDVIVAWAEEAVNAAAEHMRIRVRVGVTKLSPAP